MAIPTPIYTRGQILDQAAKISCCSANLAYTLVDNAQKGIKNCECTWDEMEYLTGAKNFLDNYYPEGAIVNEQVKNVAIFNLANYANITLSTIVVDAVNIYSHAELFVATTNLIEDIQSNINVAYTATRTGNILIIKAPLTIYSGSEITLTFKYNTGAATFTQTVVFAGGAYVMTEDMGCLTTLQVQNIIEQTTAVCGCADCAETSDSLVQPNSVIINNVVSSIVVINIDVVDFTGNTYQNNILVGLAPETDFDVFTNEGSGVLIRVNDGYTFNATTGTLTMPPQKYKILVYNA